MLKQAALLAAVCSLFATTQQAGAADYLKVLDGERVVAPWNVTVGELESADVYAADGVEIGDVEDVLMTADGAIVALSAEVGGFMGIGEREVVLDLSSLVWDGERVIARFNHEQVGSLPAWD